MKRNNIIAIGIVIILMILMGVALLLNQEGLQANKATFENVELNVTVDGEVVGTLTYDELIALGAVEYEAIYDTSKTDPVVETYKGVELKKVFAYFEISLENKSAVTATAVDNFAMAYSVEEVMADDSLYVTYERNGEAILGEEDDDGGPLMVIVKNDQFSNRRCKWLISVGVES